jgi:hypothetical protein
MICPLRTAKVSHSFWFFAFMGGVQSAPESRDCLEVECAWWNEEKKSCSVKLIAKKG